MGAKKIIERYLDRNRSSLPVDPSELRLHLAGVAKGDGLKLTEEELDEITSPRPSPEGEGESTPKPIKGEGLTGDKNRGKSGRNSRRRSISGDITKKKI